MTPERWGLIKAIFNEAIELDPADQQGFVEERCGGDAELRDEILKLLDSHYKSSNLDNPIGSLHGSGKSRILFTFEPGDVAADRFRIVRFLGEGGMAQVYEAEDLVLRCPVALKVLHPHLAPNKQFIERFRREILIGQRVAHPNVCRIHDFWKHENTFFLTMELIEGETLSQLLRRQGRLSLEEARPIVRQVVEGLAAAHAVGIVHRDLKSSNIMLTRDRVVVTDFGLALSAIAVSGVAQVTDTGLAIGTPAYMSPEQIEGQPVTAAADIYALGVVLYEAVTGQQPYQGDSPLAVVAQKMRAKPRPPRELIGSIPSKWESTILKCLALKPEDRFADVRDVAQSLDRGGARSLSRKTDIARWAALTILLVLAAAVVLLWKLRPPMPVADRVSVAVLPFVDLSPEQNQAYLADGIAEEVLNDLTLIPGLRVAGRASSMQFKGKSGSAAIGRQLNVAAILEGSVRRQGDRTKITARLIKAEDGFQLWSETFDTQVNDLFLVEEEVGRAVMSALKVTLLKSKGPIVKTTNGEVYNAYLQGKHFREQSDKESLAKAVAYFEQAIKLDPGYAPAWVGLANCRISQANVSYIPSEEGYSKAREALEQALKLDPELAAAHGAIGELKQIHDWDWKGAQASYRVALGLSPDNPEILRDMGSLARLLGRYDEAIRLYRQAVKIDPLFGHSRLGLNLYYAGRQEEAKAALDKALELTPNTVFAHSLLGRVYLAQSKPQQALEEMEKEKEPVWRIFGLALAYHSLGQRRQADAMLHEFVEKYHADAPYLIASIYAFRGEADHAFEWLDRAYAERDGGTTELKGDPLLKNIVHDPRYTAMLQKLHLPLQ